MNADTLTEGIRIGSDASGHFMLSAMGIAVRTGDGGSLANEGLQIIAGSDLVIGGSQASMYRVPTTRVDPGDLIATPDAPLVTLFMQDIADVRGIQGIDPQPIESKSMCDQRISSISNSS